MLSKPFEWDTCMMPINVADAHFRSFQNQVVPVCAKRNIGVIGFKGLGGGTGGLIGKENLTVEECLRYAMGLPVAVQIVGMTSIEQVKQNIEIARSFKPMAEDERKALLARVKEFAGDGRFERFKTQLVYDGRVHREQHGFPTQ
jgi:predicted aldo/keto reductase-like oxidoreductase